MKYIVKNRLFQLIWVVIIVFSGLSCNSNAARQEGSWDQQFLKNGKGVNSFHNEDKIFDQQKTLVFGDSLHIRVLSWGAEKTGNYLVLMADSVRQHYVGNSFFRDGILKDAWVTDLDEDGQPEVSVFVQGAGHDQYGRFFVHELKQDFSFSSVSFPQFSEVLGAEYGGHDSLYIRENRIVREYRLRNLADTIAATQLRRVEYAYENNKLEVADSEDL